MNRDEEYNRLHDHCQALGRERDGLQLQVDDLQKRIQLAVAETELVTDVLRRQVMHIKEYDLMMQEFSHVLNCKSGRLVCPKCVDIALCVKLELEVDL